MGNQLNCLEQCRAHQEQQQRLLVLQHGAVFTRKKFLLGILTGSDEIHLRLTADESQFVWRLRDDQKERSRINVTDIGAVKATGERSFRLVSRNGEPLLDLEAKAQQDYDVWVSNLQSLFDDDEPTNEAANQMKGSGIRKTIEENARKQAYWMQRTQELEERKKEAEERKKKFSAVGMKYTATAMANRNAS